MSLYKRLTAKHSTVGPSRVSRFGIAKPILRPTVLFYFLYPILVQQAFAAGEPRVAVGLMALALAGVGLWLPNTVARWSGLALGAALLAAVFMSPSALPLVFLPPSAINICLAIVFARTLLPNREPMITRLARLERRQLEPDLVIYTRHLTELWVVFFTVMAGISGALAGFGSRAAWAWFTGFGNYICVGALVIGEYIYRRRRFGQYGHLSLLQFWGVVRAALRRPA